MYNAITKFVPVAALFSESIIHVSNPKRTDGLWPISPYDSPTTQFYVASSGEQHLLKDAIGMYFRRVLSDNVQRHYSGWAHDFVDIVGLRHISKDTINFRVHVLVRGDFHSSPDAVVKTYLCVAHTVAHIEVDDEGCLRTVPYFNITAEETTSNFNEEIQ